MNTNPNSLPNQKVSFKAKDKDWQQQSIDYYVGRTGSGGSTDRYNRLDRLSILYGLYDSEFTKDDFKYVTDPYDVGDTFPANIQDYNIIRPKVDLLIGEKSKRPFDFKVIQTNPDAVSKIQEEYKNMFMEFLNATVKEEEYPVSAQDIQRYMRMNYKSVAEETAFNILNYLKERLNLSHEFLKTWRDGLVSREEIAYIGMVNGEPFLERVDPRDCDYDIDSNTDFIDQKDWFKRTMWMSPNAIYDRWRDMLDESDLDEMLAMINNNTTSPNKISPSNQGGINWSENLSSKFSGKGRDDYSTGDLQVVHLAWRSLTNLGFLTIEQEDGTTKTELVDDTYKALPDEIIEYEWVSEIWEGLQIGGKLYKARPLPYQHQTMESLNDNRLCYTGIVHNSMNAYGKSLVELMKPLQYMYMVIWYRTELALAKDKGRVLNMDITQIPKKYGIDVDRWLHYINALGINFINPYEEGWDVPGREGGKASAFNQMSSQDLRMGDVIAGYIQLLEKIEVMIGEIIGVTKQREGSIATRELVGNVERSVQQSSHITEPLFWWHSQFERRCVNLLINVAQYAYSINDKQKLQYFLSDGGRVLINITDDFIYADMDIFVTDSSKDVKNIEMLKSLLQPAMQNGATLSDAAAILTADNMTQIKLKLEEIEERRMQMMQAQQEAEQQQAQMEMELEQSRHDDEMMMKSEEIRIKEEDSIRKAEVALQTAMMSQGDGQETQPDNSMAESFERQKLEMENARQRREAALKERAQVETERKNRVAEKQKDKELIIRRKQASRKPVNNK
jgi:hypothetical protein